MSWTDDEIAAVNATLIPKGRERQRPVELQPSPHGTTPAGAADYRRFPLTRITSVILSNADFSQSRSPENDYGRDKLIMLTWAQCDNVVFDRARVFHNINGTFANCSFKRIGTSQCGFGGTFTDCDFTGTSFRSAHLRATFVRCRFHDCKMKVASWGSSFEDCEFAGATIDPVFADIRDIALADEKVTFVVLTHGVLPGETRQIN